jgi:hypothetical protein
MSPRPLFLYSNPVDFGQPPDSGPGTDDGGVVDPYIRRFLEIGGPEVRRYQRYNALLASITKVAVAGELPTVLFCVGVSEKQLRERLKRLLTAGVSKLLVYIADNADNEPGRRAVFEAGALCCWDAAVFPERNQLIVICSTDRLPYKTWKVGQKPLPHGGAVFVACSFDEERRPLFEYWVRTGLALSGLVAVYADANADAQGALGVHHQTVERLKECHLLIAILDEPYNINAVNEIGYADASGKPAILCKKRGGSELPVNIGGRVFLEFGKPEELGYCLHHGLRNAVERPEERGNAAGSR